MIRQSRPAALLSALLITACSAQAEPAPEASQEAEMDAISTMTVSSDPVPLDALLERVSHGSSDALDDVLASCQPSGLLERETQEGYALIAARQAEDGRLILSTGQWSLEDSVQRDFVLQPGLGSLRASDGAIEIVAEYRDTAAYGYVLDASGEVTFAGPLPVEFPHAIACADPSGAINALKTAGLSEFVSSGMTAEDYFRTYTDGIETDPRFTPALDACGAEGESWLLDAGYIDKPTEAYQNTIQVTIAQRYSDGFGTTTVFIPRDQFGLSLTDQEDGLRLRSIASGFTKDFSDQGPSSETNDFEEAEVSLDFTCADRHLVTGIFAGVNRWRAEGRSSALPVSFGAEVDNAGLTCSLSGAALVNELTRNVWASGMKPTVDFNNPDLRVRAIATQQSEDSALGCQYDAVIDGPALDEPIRPYPARMQNYEQGDELVSQGFTQALEGLWSLQSD